jgi:hypothetical protein
MFSAALKTGHVLQSCTTWWDTQNKIGLGEINVYRYSESEPADHSFEVKSTGSSRTLSESGGNCVYRTRSRAKSPYQYKNITWDSVTSHRLNRLPKFPQSNLRRLHFRWALSLTLSDLARPTILRARCSTRGKICAVAWGVEPNQEVWCDNPNTTRSVQTAQLWVLISFRHIMDCHNHLA